MSEIKLDDIKSYIAKMLQIDSSNYRVQVDGTSEKGDGYLGEITFLHVDVTNPKNSYDLVLKSAKKSTELRKQAPVKIAYDREIVFYMNILPDLKRFECTQSILKENCGGAFDKFPKCYSVCEENMLEALILQNMKKIGYQLHDRTTPMDRAHVEIVLKNYAYLHSLSLAMKDREPKRFMKLAQQCAGSIMSKFFEQCKLFTKAKEYFTNSIEFLKADNPNAYWKMKKIEDQIETVFLKEYDPNHCSTAIIHGDCWNNNFMFKYESNGKLIDMVFLDFQLVCVASPMLDLAYYLFCSADKTVLDHIDQLLHLYYTTLCDHLRNFQCDPTTIFTWEALKQEWSECAKYGLLIAPFILKIVLCESENAPDFADAAESGNFNDAFNVDIKDETRYQQRLRDLVLHYTNTLL